jgi:F0F1-type ATP synthase membrane subunit c/vacuolar-type H+-ATPase subunit K
MKILWFAAGLLCGFALYGALQIPATGQLIIESQAQCTAAISEQLDQMFLMPPKKIIAKRPK